jgi:hypothetical protein
MNPWLVIACPGSRADELGRCLGSLQHPPERTVIVSALHHDALAVPRSIWTPDMSYKLDKAETFSLPRLWNHGLMVAYEHEATHVAVFASDIVGHPGSIPTLAAAMSTQQWAMAGPTLHGGTTRTLALPRTTTERVPGACFMLDATHHLLLNERYRWWYGEDDLEMRAREVGPVGVVEGTGLELSAPDTALTPERQVWAVEDRSRFVRNWGCEPW